ncbi:MAG TPA: ABC transporter ATP-binding protein [Cyclobacteriaceae bacterium]|nr:ABC transporter ATP-binding protein [Cyclobacteriaceae bacterium]
MSQQGIIELVDLTKRYGDHTVVDNLTLSIPKSEVFGLLGPNGAGKSTTILMMIGLTDPTSGSVTVCGINSTRNPIEVKRKVGYLPEDVGFYEDYTGLENLQYTAQLNGFSDKKSKQRALEVLDRVGLSSQADKKVGKYSRGMRQRLGLADVLIKNPEVIILDEPTLGIDPKGVQELLSLIVALSKEEGLTVLLSSHHLHQVQEICDRVGLFVKGRLIAEGNIESLSQSLFANEPVIIEAGISHSEHFVRDNLYQGLYGINGVLSVNEKNGTLRLGCARDAAPDISRTIVESGASLLFMQKKEYGLDDIYNHYFKESGAS